MFIKIFLILGLFVSLGLGVHIVITFIGLTLIGTYLLIGLKGAMSLLESSLYHTIASPGYAVLPLFVLMGSFASESGFAKDAYEAVSLFTAKIKGSLGIATCIACAFFGAISGSSLATAAVFGKLALPEMIEHNYDKRFALGCIASAGTFASLIPPSSMLIILAIITTESVAKLFMAGVIPGILTAIAYSLLILYRVNKNPRLAPVDKNIPEYSLKTKIMNVKKVWPMLVIIIAVLGGIYSGFFTPTEAAVVGVTLTFVFGYMRGKLSDFSVVRNCLRDGAQTTAMVFSIIFGALYFGRVLDMTRLPYKLAEYVITLDIHRLFLLIIILALWFILGMLIPPPAFFPIVIPIVLPIIKTLDYNIIWFCLVSMKLSEIGAISPPVGLNAFTLKGVAGKDTDLEDVFAGSLPFIIADLAILVLLILFPELVLFLPRLMS